MKCANHYILTLFAIIYILLPVIRILHTFHTDKKFYFFFYLSLSHVLSLIIKPKKRSFRGFTLNHQQHMSKESSRDSTHTITCTSASGDISTVASAANQQQS